MLISATTFAKLSLMPDQVTDELDGLVVMTPDKQADCCAWNRRRAVPPSTRRWSPSNHLLYRWRWSRR